MSERRSDLTGRGPGSGSGAAAGTAGFPAVPAAAFERRVARADGPVLVVFVAPGCAPCARLLDWLAREAGRTAPDVAVVTVDVIAEPVAGLALRVRRVPTLALYHGGRPVARIEGPVPGRRLAAWLAHAVPRTPRRSGEIPRPAARGRPARRRRASLATAASRPPRDEGGENEGPRPSLDTAAVRPARDEESERAGEAGSAGVGGAAGAKKRGVAKR